VIDLTSPLDSDEAARNALATRFFKRVTLFAAHVTLFEPAVTLAVTVGVTP